MFNNLAVSLAAFVVVIGVMVLIHEWGHYIVAKSLGVTVKVFSIGFGKRLFGFERNGTDYRVSALPFGGYVKMAGDNPLEGGTEDPGEFNNHSRWHRFLIAIAGPAMNILFAFLVLTCIYKFHYARPVGEGKAVKVGFVDPGSPAEKAGLQPGDEIVSVGETQNPDWMAVQTQIAFSPGQPITLSVLRDSAPKQITFAPKIQQPDQIGAAGFERALPMLLTEVESGSPAAKAGLREGDTVTTIDGHKVYSEEGFRRWVQVAAGKPVHVEAVRSGQTLPFDVSPIAANDAGKPRWVVGVRSNPVEIVQLPLGEAISTSVHENGQNALMIVELMKKMVQRKVSIKAMSGPVGIAQMSGEVIRMPGWSPLLMFMCLISINLGVINLFPIPIMDGGVILLLAIEALMRRDISLNLKERIYQASFVFLVLFAAIVIFNDIAKMH
jgi:regulator of sigma E protease